ncbi:hypothetical protein RRF57_004584 [Xylaria bambusicola]|uniref:Uncharacterized protein n=1 Tax=Xylaria bambusicola TaxID=326684 RepID=A0AAN7UIC6_9PEZI
MVVELEQIISLPVWEGVAITLILLSAICVALRVFINTTGLKKFGFDDGQSNFKVQSVVAVSELVR